MNHLSNQEKKRLKDIKDNKPKNGVEQESEEDKAAKEVF